MLLMWFTPAHGSILFHCSLFRLNVWFEMKSFKKKVPFFLASLVHSFCEEMEVY